MATDDDLRLSAAAIDTREEHMESYIRKSMPCENTRTGERYKSLKEAEEKTGISRRTIKRYCISGYGWRLLEKGKT